MFTHGNKTTFKSRNAHFINLFKTNFVAIGFKWTQTMQNFIRVSVL